MTSKCVTVKTVFTPTPSCVWEHNINIVTCAKCYFNFSQVKIEQRFSRHVHFHFQSFQLERQNYVIQSKLCRFCIQNRCLLHFVYYKRKITWMWPKIFDILACHQIPHKMCKCMDKMKALISRHLTWRD